MLLTEDLFAASILRRLTFVQFPVPACHLVVPIEPLVEVHSRNVKFLQKRRRYGGDGTAHLCSRELLIYRNVTAPTGLRSHISSGSCSRLNRVALSRRNCALEPDSGLTKCCERQECER